MIGVGQLSMKVRLRVRDKSVKVLTFRPTPPAFKLTMRTFGPREASLNPVIDSFRFLMSMVPSNRYHSRPSRSKTI